METTDQITVQATINAPAIKVWNYWTKPEHIIHWAFASDDWEAPSAENDLRVGGKFKTVMSSKDKSKSFDFIGTYTIVEEHKKIVYHIDDGREVTTTLKNLDNGTTKITETFDPENENSRAQQETGWQAILNNFKSYIENN